MVAPAKVEEEEEGGSWAGMGSVVARTGGADSGGGPTWAAGASAAAERFFGLAARFAFFGASTEPSSGGLPTAASFDAVVVVARVENGRCC